MIPGFMHEMSVRRRTPPIPEVRKGKRPGQGPEWAGLHILVIGLALAGCSRAEQQAAPLTKTTSAIVQDERTALDNYVAAPDLNYSFHLVNSIPDKDQTTFILEYC